MERLRGGRQGLGLLNGGVVVKKGGLLRRGGLLTSGVGLLLFSRGGGDGVVRTREG